MYYQVLVFQHHSDRNRNHTAVPLPQTLTLYGGITIADAGVVVEYRHYATAVAAAAVHGHRQQSYCCLSEHA